MKRRSGQEPPKQGSPTRPLGLLEELDLGDPEAPTGHMRDATSNQKGRRGEKGDVLGERRKAELRRGLTERIANRSTRAKSLYTRFRMFLSF